MATLIFANGGFVFLFIFLISNVSLANATIPAEDFCSRHSVSTSCPETPWIISAKKTLCEFEPQTITTPDLILFYFDGAAYFSPREAKDSLHAVNLTGNEDSEPFHNAVHAWISLWMPAYEKLSNLTWDNSVEFHYHSGDGVEPFHGAKDGLQCFNSVSQDLEDIQQAMGDLKKPKLVLMGHSNGGAAAIGVATSTSHPVDLVLLVDPVPLTPQYIEEKISDQEVEFWKNGVPLNVSRVADVYQQTDTGSLAGFISIRGSEVPSANRLLNLEMLPEAGKGHSSDHIRMLSYPDTVDFVSSELAAVLKSH